MIGFPIFGQHQNQSTSESLVNEPMANSSVVTGNPGFKLLLPYPLAKEIFPSRSDGHLHADITLDFHLIGQIGVDGLQVEGLRRLDRLGRLIRAQVRYGESTTIQIEVAEDSLIFTGNPHRVEFSGGSQEPRSRGLARLTNRR